MVTHSSTSRPVQCLCMAERTEYTVVTRPTRGKARPGKARPRQCKTRHMITHAIEPWSQFQELDPDFVGIALLVIGGR
jgi:hypothetical protein